MRQERHVNNTYSTLDTGGSPLGSGVTTVPLTDGTGFPSEGDYRVLVEAELMLVTARAGNNLTVVRGIEGTTPAEHVDGSTVRVIVTEGALEKHLSDFSPLFIPGGSLPCRIFNTGGTPVGHTGFTWFNQGGEASAEDLDDGSILLTTLGGAGNQWRGKYMTPPSTPYTVTAALSILWIQNGSTYPQCGLILENSGDGKLVTLSLYSRVNAQTGIQICHMNSYTSFNSDPFDYRTAGLLSEVVWFRFGDDGVDHSFYMSVDGVKWLHLLTQSRTAWLSNGGDRIGFGHDRAGNDVYGTDHLTYLKHWSFG